MRARMRGQGVRRGGEELGVQGRAHARVHVSGGACGGAWGKGDGEPSGARGVQHGRGRKEREGRKEGGEGKKKKRENGKRAKEKEKEKKRERERERKRAHTGGIRGGHCGLVGHALRDVRSDDARRARRKRETGQRLESGVGSGKDFWKD